MGSSTFYRRCHSCGEVNKNSDCILERCSFCCKEFIPFFYFDEQKVSVFSDLELRPQFFEGEVQPLQGLSVFWDTT